VIGVAVALVAAAGAYWLTRPAAGDAGAPPKGAPKPGSCWSVGEAAARGTFPWPGAAVACTGPHTTEVFHVGRVDPNLGGDDAKLRQNLMYAQARRACTVLASAFLGGDWHGARVTVLADWVAPARQGHFGCAVAESADPAGTRFVTRTASLRDALTHDSDLAIACVGRGGADSALQYAGCGAPHDGEFVGTYTITPPGAPFDESAVRQAADHGCTSAALTFLGLPADGNRADLRAGYVGPVTAADWLGSDQTFACYTLATGGRTIRGSVKGLGLGDLGH
jgi:hypothetical protein